MGHPVVFAMHRRFWKKPKLIVVEVGAKNLAEKEVELARATARAAEQVRRLRD